LNRVQELKERSRRKSLFIRNESAMWAALSRQRALVEEANQWLARQSAEAADLCVAYVAVKEEAAQARAAEASACEDVARAQEEAAKAREDLVPLSAHVKELEEDVALVSRHHDAFNVQIGEVSARLGALKDEVTTLSGVVRERDEALSNAGREIEVLRATVRGKDETL
jgi:septal ring factor EnvC (AmiA/AmiB activator)